MSSPASLAPPQPRRDLDRSLIHGLAWTGAVRWGAQILSWASTLVVARLLAPSDYGVVGMATIYTGFLALVNEFGLGLAIVQGRNLDTDQIARLGGFAVLVGATFVTLSAALAGPVAAFFGEPAVRWIVVISSLAFLLTATQLVPRALLRRDLDFRRLAWADGAEAVVTTVSTLGFAVLGLRYWALVLGSLAGRATSTIVACASRPHPVALPKGLALITFPAAVGLAVVADEFVVVALGERWGAAVLPLRLLALSAALRSVSALLPQVIVSTGRAKRNMQLTLVASAILPCLFYLG